MSKPVALFTLNVAVQLTTEVGDQISAEVVQQAMVAAKEASVMAAAAAATVLALPGVIHCVDHPAGVFDRDEFDRAKAHAQAIDQAADLATMPTHGGVQ